MRAWTLVMTLLAAFPLLATHDALALVGHCTSCGDCSTKLAGAYTTVYLDNDLLNVSGSCVGAILGESNKTFDCQGHTIDGDDLSIDPEYGISLMHGSSNTIQNCVVSDFDSGIHLWDTTGHTVTANTLTSNVTGLELGFADTTAISNNTIDHNTGTGIYISNSDSNTINTNTVCQNTLYDFYLASGSGNAGDNNTCNTPDGWNDTGTTGCTSACAATITCSSCSDCSSKLSGSYATVRLTADIFNHVGTCIYFYGDGIEFDCGGHTIDGDDAGTDYGVRMSSRSGNTVRDCTIRDFHSGVYLQNSPNNTILNTWTDSNTQNGVYLFGSSGNTISQGRAHSNVRGIYVSSSSGNTIEFEDIRSNSQAGIYLASSSGSTVWFNDVLENSATNAWGMYLFASDSNTLYGNEITGNYQGIKLDQSDSNSISSNRVCSTNGGDFDLVGGSTGNSGDLNRCCSTGSWNDIGTTGCTYLCDTTPDLNGDGVSDNCDCFDVQQSVNETGVDCGGVCPACVSCSWCGGNVTPIRLRGAPDTGLIDVVFVPDGTYSAAFPTFVTDTRNIIRNAYFILDTVTADPIPTDYRDRFNFYRYTGGFGDATATCTGTLPSGFSGDAPFMDNAPILYNASGGSGCSGLGTPSHLKAPGRHPGQVIHESGHGIFGLVDEYCGDTYYTQNDPPNVWSSLGNCRTYAGAQGWDPNSCQQIQDTGCTKDFWKFDPPRDIMEWGGLPNLVPGDEFGTACVARINYVYDNWPVSGTLGVLITLHIKNGVISLVDVQVVGSHPDLGLQYASFQGTVLSSGGQPLEQFGIWDPRIGLGETVQYTDDIDFPVIVPFDNGIRTFEMRSVPAGDLLISVDLGNALDSYCVATQYGSAECQGLDLDADGAPDYLDNCPRVANPLQKDDDQDGVGNACDSCPLAWNPQQPDTDGDGIGDACQCGDASGDGILDGTDVLMSQNCFLGLTANCDESIADTDDNKVVDATDVLKVQNAFLGLTSPCSLTCARSGTPDTRPACP